MISVIRNNFNSALNYLSNLDTVNAQGGVVAWTLPPARHRAFNPILFVGEVFYAVTDSKPLPGNRKANFARLDLAGGSTGITFDYAVARTVVVTVQHQGSTSGVTEQYTISAGSTQSSRIPYYAEIVSILPSIDNSYIYLAGGKSYDNGDYLVTTSGKVFYRDTTSIDQITLAITRQYEQVAVLEAEAYNGRVEIDVSAVIRTMFSRNLGEVGGMSNIDPALCVTYSAISNNLALGTFRAANAVAQVGESSNMSNINDVLTLNSTLYYYEGYELTAAIFLGDGIVRLPMNPAASGALPIVIEERCVPPAPFYVRWINTLGGVDYWMFSKVQEFAPQVSSTSLYEQYNSDPAQAATNRRAYAIATKNGVTVGAEGAPAEAWEALQRLPFSPLIEWWNEKLGKWIGLTVAKYDGAVMTNHSTHDIEIEFALPAINTQF